MQKLLQTASFSIILIFIFLFTISIDATAQCPMCKAAAQSSFKEGSDAASGLNTGIMYLFVAPYLLIGFIGYKLYKAHKAK